MYISTHGLFFPGQMTGALVNLLMFILLVRVEKVLLDNNDNNNNNNNNNNNKNNNIQNNNNNKTMNITGMTEQQMNVDAGLNLFL